MNYTGSDSSKSELSTTKRTARKPSRTVQVLLQSLGWERCRLLTYKVLQAGLPSSWT